MVASFAFRSAGVVDFFGLAAGFGAPGDFAAFAVFVSFEGFAVFAVFVALESLAALVGFGGFGAFGDSVGTDAGVVSGMPGSA